MPSGEVCHVRVFVDMLFTGERAHAAWAWHTSGSIDTTRLSHCGSSPRLREPKLMPRSASQLPVLFVSGDLMFGSQLSFAANRAGASLVSAPTLAAVRDKVSTTTPRLVLIDLNAASRELAEIVAVLRGLDPVPYIVAFGPHVHDALLEQARSAGCDRVLTRGQFHKLLADFQAKLAARAARVKPTAG